MAERQAVFSEIMQLMADKVITPYAGACVRVCRGGVAGLQAKPEERPLASST